MNESKVVLLFVFVASLMANQNILAQSATSDERRIEHHNTGFVDFNGYYDTREFSVMTVNILAKLNHRFQYFSLTNYWGANRSSDLASFYSEQNIRWTIQEKSPVDLTVQYVIRQGDGNNDLRPGIRWRLSSTKGLSGLFKKVNMTYSANPMFFQFRENTPPKYLTIIEHVYRINIMPEKLNKRVYLGGFADQNFVFQKNGKLSFQWVSEHQLGVKIAKGLYAIVEYRINDFLPKDNYGLGYGFEFKIAFK
jgi:hypothetical protein